MKIHVGISNRHIHLTKESVDILFGKDYELTKRNNLTQADQFACNETVTIKTNKSFIANVRILGPVRSYNQVEISRTDSFKLGINPPVRNSGDLVGSEVITIIGPKGEITINACIIANRHIHISPEKARELNFLNDDIVKIKINGAKGGILDDVHIKIMKDAYLELHLDTDDGNAFLLNQQDEVELLID